jgi:hypothetical protein
MRDSEQRATMDQRTVSSAIRHRCEFQGEIILNISLSLTPLLSLVAGVLILIMPKLLNHIVAGYLIIVGLIGLLNRNI